MQAHLSVSGSLPEQKPKSACLTVSQAVLMWGLECPLGDILEQTETGPGRDGGLCPLLPTLPPQDKY